MFRSLSYFLLLPLSPFFRSIKMTKHRKLREGQFPDDDNLKSNIVTRNAWLEVMLGCNLLVFVALCLMTFRPLKATYSWRVLKQLFHFSTACYGLNLDFFFKTMATLCCSRKPLSTGCPSPGAFGGYVPPQLRRRRPLPRRRYALENWRLSSFAVFARFPTSRQPSLQVSSHQHQCWITICATRSVFRKRPFLF